MSRDLKKPSLFARLTFVLQFTLCNSWKYPILWHSGLIELSVQIQIHFESLM